MKGLKILTFVTVSVLVVAVASRGAGIADTAHNFSAKSWASGAGICGPCHTPHHALSGQTPLWAHTNTSQSTWQMYSNPATMDSAYVSTGPRDLSKVCLSCHDGTVDLADFVGSTNTATTKIADTHKVGGSGDLSKDHPISFQFTQAIADSDGELHSPTGTADIAAMLYDEYLECSSCHDPHGVDGVDKLLRYDNSSSGLCLKCHDK